MPIESNYINTTTDKTYNTYIFGGNAMFNIIGDFGLFHLDQQYTGTFIRGSNTGFRDEEKLVFAWQYPLWKQFSLKSEGNWYYTTSRSDRVNELERLNALAGFRYNFTESGWFDLLAGPENNTQSGIESTGWIGKTAGIIRYPDLDGYRLNASMEGDYLSLSKNRENAAFDINIDTGREFAPGDNLAFSPGYSYQNRDFYQFFNTQDTRLLNTESRIENTYRFGVDLKYVLLENMSSFIDFDFRESSYSRFYKSYLTDFARTGIKREIDEQESFIKGGIQYKLNNFSQELSLEFAFRSEDHEAVKSESDIDPGFFIRESQTLNNQDYKRRITKLGSSTKYLLSQNDTLSGDFFVMLTRHDTPSENNNDDKDEFWSIFNLRYGRNISQYLSATVNTEIYLKHEVFLKNERSASNNWNRILRFRPEVRYSRGGFSVNPAFEVLANYWVYDFEDLTQGVNSYSFREISYKDSIKYKFSNRFSMASTILLRYNERGILYWPDFSETPQNKIFEQFYKILAFLDFGKINIGSGFRYSGTERGSLFGQPGSNDVKQFFLGPEVYLKGMFFNNSSILLTGWYEFQYISGRLIREIPNLYLRTQINL
ncbi:MAG: hypothetical protein ACLFR2_09325 [Candidatus Kapaibacterium sp.]